MSKDKVSNPALLHIYYDTSVDLDKVASRFLRWLNTFEKHSNTLSFGTAKSISGKRSFTD